MQSELVVVHHIHPAFHTVSTLVRTLPARLRGRQRINQEKSGEHLRVRPVFEASVPAVGDILVVLGCWNHSFRETQLRQTYSVCLQPVHFVFRTRQLVLLCCRASVLYRPLFPRFQYRCPAHPDRSACLSPIHGIQDFNHFSLSPFLSLSHPLEAEEYRAGRGRAGPRRQPCQGQSLAAII